MTTTRKPATTQKPVTPRRQSDYKFHECLSIRKGKNEVIAVGINSKAPNPSAQVHSIDIRIWYYDAAEDGWFATRKGVCVSCNKLHELKRAIELVEAKLKEMGVNPMEEMAPKAKKRSDGRMLKRPKIAGEES